MIRSAVLVHLRLVLVLLCAGGLMLCLGCSPSSELGGERTEWRRCEHDLASLARCLQIWQRAHHGRLPQRLDDLDMEGVSLCCPYSGFVYGYRPDPRYRTFRIVCRGWSHRADLGDVNMQVDSQTPDCIAFNASPAPNALQERALRLCTGEAERSIPGRYNLTAWLVGFCLAVVGMRHVMGLVPP